MELIASYDFGTSGVKAVLVDGSGKVKGYSSESYPLLSPQPGWAEQVPGDYWTAVCKATRAVVAQTGVRSDQIKGLVFGAMWKGIIPIDRYGNELHNCIIWLDGRAGKQARELNERMGTQRFCAQDYWPKLMWLRDERPEIYEKSVYILENNAYLKYKATGKMASDLSNCFTSSTKPELNEEYGRIVQAAALDADKFPPCVDPWENVGGITASAAVELGLCEGTPVFGGCGDIPAIAVGSGSGALGAAHLYLGSSGWLGLTGASRTEVTAEAYQSLDREKEILLYTLQSACMSFDWAISLLYAREKEELGSDVYRVVNEDVSKVPPGSEGLIATTWLHGERPPLSETARAMFFNLNARHRREHCLNAMMEAVCCMFRWKLEAYEQTTGRVVPKLRIVGGGTQSPHWMQMMADVLQVPIEIPPGARHAGAVGTAYCALIGLGLCRNFEEANERIGVEQIYLPRKEHAVCYEQLFRVIQELYTALKNIFYQLNA